MSSKGQITIPKKNQRVGKRGNLWQGYFYPSWGRGGYDYQQTTADRRAFRYAEAPEAGKACFVEKNGIRNTEKAGEKEAVMIALDTNALVRMLIESVKFILPIPLFRLPCEEWRPDPDVLYNGQESRAVTPIIEFFVDVSKSLQ